MLKSMELAQYPLSIIINSFTPNQQGHNMLQLQLSTIFPLKFHVIAMSEPTDKSYLSLMVEVSKDLLLTYYDKCVQMITPLSIKPQLLGVIVPPWLKIIIYFSKLCQLETIL